ncbi:uncharacterized protein [Henckelia pumila]|uniref:uncharacterized protein n=1 Tax=Henckelia pumila TaxID=405737 RepID=UPI003C6DC9DF
MALFFMSTLFILACLASPLLHPTTATATATTNATGSSLSRLFDDVCKSTTGEAFCHAVQRLDPRKNTIEDDDLYGLALVAFSLTYFEATTTKNFIHSWLGSEKGGDPKQAGMRRGMLHCEADYKQAIGALQKSFKDLINGNFERVVKWAKYVKHSGEACAEALHGYPADAYMANNNQDFIDFAHICVVFSKYLSGRIVN